MMKYKMKKWPAFLPMVKCSTKFDLILKYLLETLFTSSRQYTFWVYFSDCGF